MKDFLVKSALVMLIVFLSVGTAAMIASNQQETDVSVVVLDN